MKFVVAEKQQGQCKTGSRWGREEEYTRWMDERFLWRPTCLPTLFHPFPCPSPSCYHSLSLPPLTRQPPSKKKSHLVKNCVYFMFYFQDERLCGASALVFLLKQPLQRHHSAPVVVHYFAFLRLYMFRFCFAFLLLVLSLFCVL